MKNILIIVPSLNGGGAERTASLLANKLVQFDKYKVYMCLLSDIPIYYKLDERVEIFYVDRNIKSKFSIDKNIKRSNYISNKARELKIDLIIGYTIIGGILSCLVKLKVGVDNIVCERQDPNQFRKSYRFIRNLLYRKATAAVFQTDDAERYFTNIVRRSIVIPNFLDVKNMPKPLNYAQRKNRIINIGRLEPAKNQSLLIRVFAQIHDKFPEYTLEIYGDGSQYQNLKRQIESYGLNDKIFLRGFSFNIFDDIKNAKLFVFTSNYEGYPNALLESMAMGLVSISTDCPCGGPRSMIKDGENGFLIPVGDEKKLKRKIVECLENEELMEKISQNAQKIRESNNAESILEKWTSYIDQILCKS